MGANKVLDCKYFARPATELAADLLGKWLCVRRDGVILKRRITETECYYGEEDTACHAHKGKTPRTEVMYLSGGITYVYLCYGIHSLLNLVTGPEGHPEAVLIRAVEGVVGPGRVTKFFSITQKDNRVMLEPNFDIWLEDDQKAPLEYKRLPRVGIDYADLKDRQRLWRFVAIDR